MSGGHIDGREINALTINADEAVTIYSFDDGYKICLGPSRARFTLSGNKFPYVVPGNCWPLFVVNPPCAEFSIPAKGGCS